MGVRFYAVGFIKVPLRKGTFYVVYLCCNLSWGSH